VQQCSLLTGMLYHVQQHFFLLISWVMNG